MKLLGFSLAILLFLSCSKADQTFELNETEAIPFGKTAKLNDGDKPIFKFTALLEESRCPEGTNCIWAGRALVELTVDDNQTIELGLGTQLNEGAQFNQTAIFDKYEVELMEVSFKNNAEYGKEDKYSVKIKVSKTP